MNDVITVPKSTNFDGQNCSNNSYNDQDLNNISANNYPTKVKETDTLIVTNTCKIKILTIIILFNFINKINC